MSNRPVDGPDLTRPYWRRRSTVVLAVLTIVACGRFTPTVRRVSGALLTVETARGVTLEVVDWGGTGRTLLFLAGGGHTAHEFDEFAPGLTDTFRVVGLTRRGVGASAGSQPRTARDGIRDIARVLDALGLDSVVLVGHSQGGLEAAQFARAYPDRCLGIVHLESAYLGDEQGLARIVRFTPPPAPPVMTRADSASPAAVRAWTERTQGFLIPESEIRAVNVVSADGRIVGPAPRNTSPKYDWFGKLPPLRWEAIDCPSLGLYAVTAPLETWLPHYADRYESMSPEERERADAYVSAFSAWTADRRAEFGRLPQNEVIEFHATGHYFFLEQPEQDRALAAIRQFVAGLSERRRAGARTDAAAER